MHIAVRACFSVWVAKRAENSIKLNTQSHLAPILFPWHTETWGTNTHEGKRERLSFGCQLHWHDILGLTFLTVTCQPLAAVV